MSSQKNGVLCLKCDGVGRALVKEANHVI